MSDGFAVEMRGITKTFGSVVANRDVDLDLRHGEILALLGENGSGKTTLMNMLSGIYAPDSGSIRVEGKPAVISSPQDAKRLGIGMVHQHFKLVDVLSAADNIWMGAEKAGALLRRDRYEKIAEVARRFGFDIDPRKQVANMAVSEKQTLEIIKVLYYGAKVIILDEPTAVLTVQEIDKLFSVLRRMKEEGHSIIIITHKLNEVMDISDRVAILRKGEHIATVDTASTNEQELTEWMVGRKMDLNIQRPVVEKTRPLLELRDLTVRSDEGSVAIDHVSFYIRGGEMLGVAGIAGCGQKELCEAIAGLRPIEGGQMIHKGDNIVGLSPKAILDKGISMSFIPEDRLGMGLAPSLSITDNMLLKNYGSHKGPFVDRKAGRADAERVIRELQELGKPFIVLLNSADPRGDRAQAIAKDISSRYEVNCMAVNCLELDEDAVAAILKAVLYEFPMQELDLFLPPWVDALPADHPIKAGLYDAIRQNTAQLRHIREVEGVIAALGESEHISEARISAIDLGTGVAAARLALPRELFYKTLSEQSGFEVGDDGDLMSLLTKLAAVKAEYDKVAGALHDVRETGYGIVVPGIDELKLEEPEIMKQGGRYGVRLKASAPSIHMIRADIETAVSPIVGNEKQSEDMVNYLLQEFEGDTSKIWQSNIFGRSFHELVNEDLQAKLKRMPEDARRKLQETLTRIINEGSGGLICIIL